MVTHDLPLFLAGTSTGMTLRSRSSPAELNSDTTFFVTGDGNQNLNAKKNKSIGFPKTTTVVEGHKCSLPMKTGDVRNKISVDRRRMKAPAMCTAEDNQKKGTVPYISTTKMPRKNGKLSPSLKRGPLVDDNTTRSKGRQRNVSAASRSVSRDCTLKRQGPLYVDMPTRGQLQDQRRSISEGITVRTTTTTTATTTSVTGQEQSRVSKTGVVSSKTKSFPCEGLKKSFIDSLILCDDDSWRPSFQFANSSAVLMMKKKKKEKEKRKISVGNEMPTLEPLPMQTVRKLYAEDLDIFKENNSASPACPLSPQLLINVEHSNVNRLVESDVYDDFMRSRHASISNTERDVSVPSRLVVSRKTGIHSLHTWNEPPSNVLLPHGKLQHEEETEEHNKGLRDVWYVRSYLDGNGNEKNEWMRSLQYMGQAEKKIDPVIPGNAVDTCLTNLHDDDYHSIFHNLQLHQKQQRRSVIDVSKISKGQQTPSATQGFTNSFAACSALLQAPQRLLDSEFLVSSSHSFSPLRNINQWVMTFASNTSGNTLSPLTTQSTKLVELSYPAKVLYIAVLYLRALGGFPTLLRISPLQAKCGVVGKEHCVELVFSSSFGTTDDNNAPLQPVSGTNASYTDRRNPLIKNRSNTSGSNEKNAEERSVVLRSVFAEKSVVERFGKREVVHVLPPLQDIKGFDNEYMDSAGKMHELELKSNAVHNLLHETESKLQGTRTAQFQRNKKGSDMDCGDIAVAFLMSAEASKFSGMLPEPMDLEGLRYKVYGLRQHEPYDVTDVGKESASVAFSTAQQQRHPHQGTQPSTLKLNKEKLLSQLKFVEASTAAPCPAVSLNITKDMDMMRQRFPPYSPVSIAESTLEVMGVDGVNKVREDDGTQSELRVPYFCQLRLPRLYTDLVDAIEFALNLQDRFEKRNDNRPRFF